MCCVELVREVVGFRYSTRLEKLAGIEIGEWSSKSVFSQDDSSHSQSGGYQLAGTPRFYSVGLWEKCFSDGINNPT